MLSAECVERAECIAQYCAISILEMRNANNDMMSIFDDMDSPFYKSALTFAVDEIDPTAFSQFIADRFKKGNRKISPAVIAKILEFAEGVSGDVQQLSEALWESTEPKDTVMSDHFGLALDLIYSRELKGYETIMEHLTSAQTAVLRALAADSRAKPFSLDFTSRVNMPTSSVRRVLQRLMDDRLVYLHKGEHRFSNPFFKAWLQSRA